MKRAPNAGESERRFDQYIQSARSGSPEALGRLLEDCRPYLLLIANQELPENLRGKAGGSDLVQDTFLQAQKHFDRFHDATEPQLLAWLRQILLNNVAKLNRHYFDTEKCQVRRELPILDGPFGEPFPEIRDPGRSPSSLVAAEEQDAALREALERLSKRYRQVLTWRSYERLPFEEIGLRLGRSARAARKLWVRAVERLHEILDAFNG